MRASAIATLAYLLLTLTYKLKADPTNITHTNLYWLYSSIVFCIIFMTLRNNAIIKIYKTIFLATSFYWMVMSCFHFICIFRIELYEYSNVTNQFTVGAACILLIIFYLTGNLFRHDTKKQR